MKSRRGRRRSKRRRTKRKDDRRKGKCEGLKSRKWW